MNIILIGYGKIAKQVEIIALREGYKVIYKINSFNFKLLENINFNKINIAIEFTSPMSAYYNIYKFILRKIPIISGTTDWSNKKSNIEDCCKLKKGTFFYSSNFNIGINLFFKINDILLKRIKNYQNYNINIKKTFSCREVDIFNNIPIFFLEKLTRKYKKKKYSNFFSKKLNTLNIAFKKQKYVKKYIVSYKSNFDEILIQHSFFNQNSFAITIILIAKWIKNKKGVLSMKDFLFL